jgi:hypothetical protein
MLFKGYEENKQEQKQAKRDDKKQPPPELANWPLQGIVKGILSICRYGGKFPGNWQWRAGYGIATQQAASELGLSLEAFNWLCSDEHRVRISSDDNGRTYVRATTKEDEAFAA